MVIEFSSDAFEAGRSIPTRYSCEGEDVSPPLSWHGTPADAASMALICDDPDAPNGTFTHWLLYNIPAEKNVLSSAIEAGGKLSWGASQGRNDFGDVQYGGPCPPVGDAHHYSFRLYALDENLDLPPGLTRAQLLDRIRGHVLEEVELVGLFSR